MMSVNLNDIALLSLAGDPVNLLQNADLTEERGVL